MKYLSFAALLLSIISSALSAQSHDQTAIFQQLYELEDLNLKQRLLQEQWDPCSRTFNPGKKVRWNHLRSLLVSKLGRPRHGGHDVVATQFMDVKIRANFSYGLFSKDIEDEPVEVFIANQRCQWYVKTAGKTDSDGRFEANLGRLPTGKYPIKVVLKPNSTVATLLITVLERGTKTAVFDIDGTLTTSDGELIHEIISRVFKGDYVPKMRDGAVDAVNLMESKGYELVYLTGRPYPLHRVTKSWLLSKSFPRGSLILTNSNSQSVPNKKGVGTFKAKRIKEIKASKINVDHAFGNALTDIYAYDQAQVSKHKTHIVGKHAGKENTSAIAGYAQYLKKLESLPSVNQH
jgi:hypothetical protein